MQAALAGDVFVSDLTMGLQFIPSSGGWIEIRVRVQMNWQECPGFTPEEIKIIEARRELASINQLVDGATTYIGERVVRV